MIDWSQCTDVERIPGKVSGAWLVVGTRIPADAVLDNAEDGYTAEKIVAEIYPSLPLDRAQRILAYAREPANAPHPPGKPAPRRQRNASRPSSDGPVHH